MGSKPNQVMGIVGIDSSRFDLSLLAISSKNGFWHLVTKVDVFKNENSSDRDIFRITLRLKYL